MSLLGYINNGLNQSLNGIVTITDGNGTTISDGEITSKNMNVDTFSATNFQTNNLTVLGTLTLPNGSILDVYLSSNIPKKDATNTYTSLQTLNNGLTITSGTITLPNASISDNALSSNVCLLDATQTLTKKTLTDTNQIKFSTANPDDRRQITLYETSTTNHATNYFIGVSAYAIHYNVRNDSTHRFTIGSGTTYTDYLTINSDGTTINTSNLTITNGNIVFTTGNKTITNGTGNVLTLPTSTTTLIGNNTFNTLTNKTIDAGTFTGDNLYNGNAIIRTTNTNKYVLRVESTGFGANNSKSEIYESAQDLYIDLYDSSSTLRNQIKLTYSGLNLAKGFIKLENNIGDKLIYFENITDKYYTELQNYVLRTGVPSIASHNFRCGTTDIVQINSSGLTLNTGILTLPPSSISDSALSTNIPKKNQYNVWNNYNDFYNPVAMYNAQPIVFKDEQATPTQTNVSQYFGGFYMGNYSQTGDRKIYFGSYDQQSTPLFDWRFTIRYDYVEMLRGIILRIYNVSNTNFNEINQNLYNMYITNWAGASQNPSNNGQAIILRTINNVGGLTTNMTIQYDKVTMGQNLQVDGNLTFPNTIATKITYYTGYYTDIFQSTIIGLRNVVPSNGTHIFKVGDNDEVKIDATYSTFNNNILQFGSNYIEQLGTGANIFKTSTFNGNVQIKVNIEFTYTTLSTPTSTELGHVRSAVILPNTAFGLSTNTMYNCAEALLDIGVWSVTFQVCYKCTSVGGGTTNRFEYGLSTTSATFDNLFIDRMFGGPHGSNEFVYNRTTRTFTVTSGTLTIYAVIRLIHSSGTYQTGGVTIGTSNYISMQAVRIA